MSNNAAKIQKLKDEIAALEKADAEMAALGPDHRIAIKLHDMLCTQNPDGCSWYYEIKKNVHDWNTFEHGRYLKKAIGFHAFCLTHNVKEEDLFGLLTFVRGY